MRCVIGAGACAVGAMRTFLFENISFSFCGRDASLSCGNRLPSGQPHACIKKIVASVVYILFSSGSLYKVTCYFIVLFLKLSNYFVSFFKIPILTYLLALT